MRVSSPAMSRRTVGFAGLAIVVIVAFGWGVRASSSTFDPCDGIEHRVYPDTATAIRRILKGAPRPRVYAVGEYHPDEDSRVPSPLARFIGEIIHLLDPRAHHLVLEAWLEEGCSFDGEKVGAQVVAELGRTLASYRDLERLLVYARRLDVETHGLSMSCLEHGAMLDPRGRVDFFRLLETIAMKLHERARQLAAEGKAIIVYGGALHNDLYPMPPLATLSYARELADELGGVLEIDLVVPEVVMHMPFVRRERWYPLLRKVSPDRAIVWQRAIDSYVVILPSTPNATTMSQSF